MHNGLDASDRCASANQTDTADEFDLHLVVAAGSLALQSCKAVRLLFNREHCAMQYHAADQKNNGRFRPNTAFKMIGKFGLSKIETCQYSRI
jgi:hypothetical protein